MSDGRRGKSPRGWTVAVRRCRPRAKPWATHLGRRTQRRGNAEASNWKAGPWWADGQTWNPTPKGPGVTIARPRAPPSSAAASFSRAREPEPDRQRQHRQNLGTGGPPWSTASAFLLRFGRSLGHTFTSAGCIQPLPSRVVKWPTPTLQTRRGPAGSQPQWERGHTRLGTCEQNPSNGPSRQDRKPGRAWPP